MPRPQECTLLTTPQMVLEEKHVCALETYSFKISKGALRESVTEILSTPITFKFSKFIGLFPFLET